MSAQKKCFDHIAEIVQARRNHAKLSQEELSKLLGYKNGQFISNVERGKCSLPVEKICLFCEATNTATDNVIKALLWDYQMTVQGVVIKDPKRKMVKLKFNF